MIFLQLDNGKGEQMLCKQKQYKTTQISVFPKLSRTIKIHLSKNKFKPLSESTFELNKSFVSLCYKKLGIFLHLNLFDNKQTFIYRKPYLTQEN